jgi:hypothetical protein
MVRGIATKLVPFALFQEFSMRRRQVRVEVCEVSTLNLLVAYLPSRDCNDGMPIQRSPNYVHHRESVE